ncbi:outer membrane lipoprotein carrier protein LolA [Desulfococcus sp.]|uniref:LolA family protein n=1 Tax=Desulfococcus sp. TaxID=2025834 RepID=UPI0035932B30
MMFRWILIAGVWAWMVGGGLVWAQSPPAKPGAASPSEAAVVDRILSGVEKTYAGEGFVARFHQQSTLRAMDITDTAEGRLMIKHPDKMRWEYESPEKQLVITNGEDLWIYRPEDNQVMIGSAPEFFKGGKGASFMSDIRRIRKHFGVSLDSTKEGEYYLLKLIPKDEKLDLVSILMKISAATFEVTEVTTANSYGDQTLIRFDGYRFNLEPRDAEFGFDIPDGADVVRIAE